MSEVISFRLDRNNPREAQALTILLKGQEAGYSLRHILTEALLALESTAEDEQAVAVALAEVAGRLEQILVEQVGEQLAAFRVWLDEAEIELPPRWDLDAIYRALVDERVGIARIPAREELEFEPSDAKEAIARWIVDHPRR